jgi:FtsP/CotA-like multicopper oxidase with cupredoxin domain
MHLKTLSVAIPVAMTGALLLCSPAGIGWAHDKADHAPTHQVHGSAPEAAGKAEDTGPSEATVIERTLGDGPAETIVVSQGTTVRLVLHAPAGTQLHLHGYELAGTATDTSPVVMTFHADHPGRYPIEAHGVQDVLGRTDKALAYLEVRPE